MVVHQVFAHILDNKIKNVIVCDNYEVANQLARSIYGQNAIAVECTQYPCGIGDFYIDNSFHYRDKDDPNKVGDPVPRKNTAEEDAFEANSKATVLQDDVAANTVDIEYLRLLPVQRILRLMRLQRRIPQKRLLQKLLKLLNKPG